MMRSRLNPMLPILVLIFLANLPPARAEEMKVTPPQREGFVVNPQFNIEKTPPTEPALNLEKSAKAVQEGISGLDQDIKKFCAKKKVVFRINKEKSTLKVTSFKNYKIPVVGKFTNFDGYVVWSEKKIEPKSVLFIDTTSWETGVADRDLRVKRYLLKADDKKNALSELEVSYKQADALTPGTKEMEGDLRFRGTTYPVKTKIELAINEQAWQVRSVQPFRLNAKLPKKDLLDIMSLCNHESLAPSVDLEWDLNFTPACK